MQRASIFRIASRSRWLRAIACTVACSWLAAPAFAQHDADVHDEAEPVLLAMGPAGMPGGELARQPRLSLDVRPSLPAAGIAPDSTDFGLKWRQPFGSRGQSVDFAAWRRTQPPTDALSLIQQREPVFGARLEFQLPSSNSRFISDLKDMRFIGLQLDSGAKVGIRRSNGNPTLYYRSTF